MIIGFLVGCGSSNEVEIPEHAEDVLAFQLGLFEEFPLGPIVVRASIEDNFNEEVANWVMDQLGNDIWYENAVSMVSHLYNEVWIGTGVNDDLFAEIMYDTLIEIGGFKSSQATHGINYFLENIRQNTPIVEKTPTPAPTSEPVTPTEPEVQVSREFTMALDSGRGYLRFMNFSREGLGGQLDFEGFPQAAINWALDQLDAETDWYEQAVGSAESYFSFMSFSREGLYNQLLFEGFTSSQAQHAVDVAFD